MDRKKIIDALGGLGLLSLVAGLYTASIKSGFTRPALGLVLLGAGAAAAWCVLNAGRLKDLLAFRGNKYRGAATLTIVVVALILGMLNWLAARHHKRFDFSADAAYSLSSQTVQLLQGLKTDVTLVAFARTPELEKGMRDIFNEYGYHTQRLHVEFVDLNKRPGVAKQYGVDRDGTIIVKGPDKIEKLTEQPTEERLTNAILKVTRTGKKTIYFCDGHLEKDIENTTESGYSLVKKALEDANYEVKKILLLRENKVPDDCAVLVVAGPQKDYLQPEKDAIQAYLNVAGTALIMVDPQAPGLADLLARWEVTVGNDILVDENPAGRYFGTSEFMPVVISYESHKITRGFKAATLFPLARSVRGSADPREGVETQELLKTSNQSWAETRFGGATVSFNEKEDLPGPVSLAVAVWSREKDRKDPEELDSAARAATANTPDRKTRLVVIGDADFCANSYFTFSGNRDFFLNAVSWLAEEEDMISIRPKEQADRRIFLTLEQSRVILWFVLLLAPLLVLVAGIWVWLKRRQ
jgi:ABC-type uncharacterized transport system involved in gliding motility auxiliary subunit